MRKTRTTPPWRIRRSVIGRALLSLLVIAAAMVLLPRAAWGNIDIHVKGNDFFRTGTLLEALPPDPEKLGEEDIASWREDALFNAEDLYRRDGFFDARIEVAVKPKVGGKPEDWEAEVLVEEGQRYRFDTVRVVVVEDTSRRQPGPSPSGDAAGDPVRAGADTTYAETVTQPAPAARAVVVEPDDLDARPENPFREDFLFRDRRVILRKFGNAGFVRAQVEDKLTVRPATRTVGVDYLVEPSYPVVFDTLILRNRRARPMDSLEGLTDDGILRGLVHYERGDTVRVSTNDRLIEKLQYTGAFNFVRLKDSLQAEDGGGSALILISEERVPGNFRTSLFLETHNDPDFSLDPGISVDGRHSNLAGSLNELRGGASLAKERQTSYLGYGSPLTLGHLMRFDDDLSFNWYQHLLIHEDQGIFGGDFEAANSARLTFPLFYWLRLTGSAELEAKSRMVASGLDRDLNLNFIQTTLVSFLNNTMDPTRGVKFALTFGNGGPFVRADDWRFAEFRHNWIEAQSAYYYYYPPFRQLKIATRLEGGRFFGEGGANSLRFFLGGPRSVRTFDFRSLCPEKDTLEACLTPGLTAAYFLVSQEFRMEVFNFSVFNRRGYMKHLVPLQIVPFYDLGKVWDVHDGFSFTTQHQGQGEAFGLGFRYPLLGIFNFRLDLAYGAPGQGRWPDKWIIDLAQAF